MKSISFSEDVFEERRWCWQCPECGYMNESPDDISYEYEVDCQKCCKEIKVEE